MQPTEHYTPGYSRNASDFMARRLARTHAAFLLPHLSDASRLLDCGCGPGSMTCDFARLVPSGHVTGIDREASQIERARSDAASHRLTNVNFETGSIYELPFLDSSFDVVFAHAVFEHVTRLRLSSANIWRSAWHLLMPARRPKLSANGAGIRMRSLRRHGVKSLEPATPHAAAAAFTAARAAL